jgi:hypothetical protein
MYGTGFKHDMDPRQWALQQLDRIRREQPRSEKFLKYMDEYWRGKVDMWCILLRNVPHAGQNTNAGIESFHANLKSILVMSKQRYCGRSTDWLLWQLVYEVTVHYWYARFLKLYGFVRNTKQEFVIASAIIRAREIRDENVDLYPEGEDLAYVVSVNNYPKVWTVYCLDSVFAQCDCPIGKQGMVCKHSMKAFQLIHPNLEDGFILRNAGTKYGIDSTVPLSQVLKPPLGAEVNDIDLSDVFLETQVPTVDDGIHMGSATHPIDLSVNSTRSHPDMSSRAKQAIRDDPEVIFKDLVSTAEKHKTLQNHLVSDLKLMRGKFSKILARGVRNENKNDTTAKFPEREGDWSLKRKRGRLEGNRSK